MNIGEAAAASGVSAKMIRYYEEIGLVMPERRTASNYRVYGEREVNRLRFVRRARTLGFSLEETERLLGLWNEPADRSDSVRLVAMGHLRDLEEKMEAMRSMVDTLKTLVDDCAPGESACPNITTLTVQNLAPGLPDVAVEPSGAIAGTAPDAASAASGGGDAEGERPSLELA